MNEKNVQKQEVRVHIDRKPYMSPNPTTGAALYLLAQIPANRELFREENGNREDELVPNNDAKIHLIQDEHFYSEQIFNIIVNGQKKEVTKKVLSYAEIVALDPDSKPGFQYTIIYRKGPPSNREGTLLEGQLIKIKNGMVFNVTPTIQS
ncbi:MAG: multiubiquitin domain-containing protein [Chitinispirillaceae bacterium]|jgi:hypothetical protein